MKKAIILIMLIPQLVIGQIVQTIRGKVVDKETKNTIVGANIIVLDIQDDEPLATATDINGNFSISKVPVGRRTIRCTYLGYKEVLLNNIVVESGKQMVLNLEMEETVSQLKDVVIKATRNGEALNDMSTVSSRQFSVEETDRYAGSRGEPARMASNFAGVQGADDSRNDIVIRGNSPQGLLWRVEGVSIPNPNHFAIAGTTGGPVSIISNKILANSDFFTGAFPAEYSNSIAGVFDLRLRNGNNQKHEFSGQFGFLGTEVMAEGPLSKKNGSSYLFTYRYANLWLFSKIGIDIGTQAVPSYQDLSFKLNFPLKKSGNFSIWSIAGTSTVDILISEQDATDRNIFGENDRDQYFTSKMGIAGVTLTKPVSKKAYIKASLATSAIQQTARHEYLFLQRDAQYQPVVVDNKFVVDSIRQLLGYVFTESKYSATVFYNTKINNRLTFKTGVNLDLLHYNFLDSVKRPLVDSVFNTTFTPWQVRWNSNENVILAQPYAQLKYYLTSTIVVNAGLNATYFSINDNSFSPLEPRLGLSYELPKNQRLSAAVGLHSQTQPSYLYYYGNDIVNGKPNAINRDMGLTKSWHYVLGYEKLLKPNTKIKFETYYQSLFNIPVGTSSSSFSLVNAGSGFSRIFPDSLVNSGTGRNYGFEMTLEKYYSKGYYYLITASVFDAKYKGSDGVLRNTDYNGTFAVNLLFSKEFKVNKHSTLGLGAKATTIGGRWFGPVDSLASAQALEVIYVSSTRNTERFNAYKRIDFKIDYKVNRPKVTHTIAVDLVNPFGFQNVLSLSYAPQSNGSFIRQEYQLGFLPVFFYRIDF